MRELIDAAPAEATVDLERRVVTLPSGREVAFDVDEDVRYRLLNGYDDIGLTLQRVDEIDAYERERERPGPSHARALDLSATGSLDSPRNQL